jgi:flagellar basal-body rod modification protein FlgD
VASTTVNSVLGQSGAQASDRNAFDKLDLQTFTKLLVTELQNQDPLSPMDSAQIIQQISQIRSIEASTQLTTTLEAVLLGQNVATASGLLGRTIKGLTDDSKQIAGVVESVSVADGVARLHIGENTVELKNVSEILPENK